MRRRRTALQAVTAAAAVLVIASGGALAAGNLTSTVPQPAPAPAPTDSADPSPTPSYEPPEGGWVTTIPEDFRIDDGLPEPGGDYGEWEVDEGVRTPWYFDPCREAQPGEESRTDFLQVTQSAPAERRMRQLALYPDPGQAEAVVERFHEDLARCPRHQLDGGGEDIWEEHEQGFAGDASFSAVAYFEQDGMRVTPATYFAVVRVGNAVLVSSYDGEFGAAQPDDMRSIMQEHRTPADTIAERMCVFGDDGCGEPEPTEEETSAGGAGLDDSALLALEDLESLTSELTADWEQIEDRENPTLDCQADWLSSLGPEGLVFREFAGTGASGDVVTEAATAVLGFADADEARTAFDTVSGWISACDERMDGTRPVSIAHDVVPGSTGHGPSLWRVVESPAPEVCTECDTGWLDAQGVALVGDRLAVLSIAYVGDMMSGQDTASSPMGKAIRVVADLAAAEPAEDATPTLGPTGLGDLELGMYTWEDPAASMLDIARGGDGPCETFRVEALGPRDGIDGFASENLGVMAIFARPGTTTPEGVGPGSTEAEVKAAHPGGEDLVPGYRVSVPGYPDRYYEFGFDGGKVESLVLALNEQICFG
jgi:hypothetical protein